LSFLEILVAALIVIAFGGIVSYTVHLKYKNVKLASGMVQAVVDKNTIKKQLEDLVSNKTVKDIEETDGFLKFLSESRDSAFEYIEDVQKTLYLFKDNMEPIVEAYRDSGTAPEHMRQVVKAYDEVVSLLPADE